MINQERLKYLLDYNEFTGILSRKYPGPGIKVGPAGTLKDGYIYIVVDGKQYLAHRLIWLYVYGSFPENQIDHIDRNRSNNRLNNLREATKRQNQWNIGPRSRNKSGYKGVSKRGNKWRARININGYDKWLGIFPTEKEAYTAYCSAAKQLHGEFLNV
jgi:hypothetical protein